MPLFPTACPRNCYSSCSFLARIEEGRLTGIEPNPANLATAEGPCLKGLSYVERAHSPDRILYPMQKNSRGGFDRIPWDHALEVIAAKLVHLRSTDGPHAVLFYESSGMAGLTNEFSSRFWKLFGGASTTYGNLCWPAGLEAVRLTLGENKHNLPWDLQNSKLIILWGKNPAETNIHQMVFIEKAASQGAKVIVIDLRRTPSSERADLLIQPKPGTDAAIAASDITLVRGDLNAVVVAIGLSRATLRIIKQNLGWAFGYNIAMVPLAVAGVVNPMLAGAAMAASSVCVVFNSLRLNRVRL